MNTMKPGALIADHPAWSIHEPTPQQSYALGINRPIFRAGDVIGLPWETRRYGTQHRWYRFGSCASYALQYDHCPIRSYERAKRKGHKTHWLNAEATVLTDRPSPKETRIGLNWGDEVVFEGRLFRIEKAPNNNAALVEVEI